MPNYRNLNWEQPLKSLATSLNALLPFENGVPNFVHTLQIVTAKSSALDSPVSHVWSCQNDLFRKVVADWTFFQAEGVVTFGRSLVGVDYDEFPYRYSVLGSPDPIYSEAPRGNSFTYVSEGPWQYKGNPSNHNLDKTKELAASWEAALTAGFGSRGATMWVTQSHSGQSPEHLLNVSSAFVVFNRAIPAKDEYRIAKQLRDFLIDRLFMMHRVELDAQKEELGRERGYNEQLASRLLGEAAEGLTLLGPKMKAYLKGIEKIILSTSPMLLVGESGSGKLEVAREIHRMREYHFSSIRSPREKGQAYQINLQDLPGTNDAIRLRICEAIGMDGLSEDVMQEERHKGTIIFNDIHQSSRQVQEVILDLLDRSYKLPIKGWFPLRKSIFISLPGIDVAANSGRFNPSLFAQMSPFVVYCPPLSELKEDLRHNVPQIVEILKQALGIDTPFELTQPDWQYIESHSWPGNYRELYAFLMRKMLQS